MVANTTYLCPTRCFGSLLIHSSQVCEDRPGPGPPNNQTWRKTGDADSWLNDAIFLHSIWNGSGAIFGGRLYYIPINNGPAFLILLVVIGITLNREGKVVREYLLSDLQRGLFTRQNMIS